RFRSNVRQNLRRGAPKLARQFRRLRAIHIINRRHMKSAIRQMPRHVRAHPANTNETDVHILISVARRSAEPSRYPYATMARRSLTLPALFIVPQKTDCALSPLPLLSLGHDRDR